MSQLYWHGGGAPPLTDIMLVVKKGPDGFELAKDSQLQSPKFAINVLMRLAKIPLVTSDTSLPDGVFKIVVGQRVSP